MGKRSNEEWLRALRSGGRDQDAALAELGVILKRAAFFFLQRHRHQLKDLAAEEIEALAEDAAQEAAMAIRMKLDSFRGESAFVTWASKFGVGMALAITRKRQWRDLSLDTAPSGWDQPAAQTVASRDGWQRPELAAERQEIWRTLRDAIETELTEKQRVAIDYQFLKGVSPLVVADRLGISRGALYKLTHDARRKLRQALEGRGFSAAEMISAFAAPE